MAKFNEIIHQPIRLQIMASLVTLTGQEEIDFTSLRELLNVTDGNLGAHLRKLEEVEYIAINKEFIDRKPRSYISATLTGRKVFKEHVSALEEIFKEQVRNKMSTMISVKDLYKAYGETQAVNGISFQVEEGEIFGMVGPNGAGKTTAIECVEGLRKADSGEVRVLDLDPIRQERQLRPQLGIQLQQAFLPENLKVWEALDMYKSFYDHTVDWEELLEELGLAEKRNTSFRKLSGGQKQRLFIALALLNDPKLVFLDELTTGLDPHARHTIWDLVREVQGRGKTVFLTTHYMEEAENLCSRVAIMDRGKIVALDTPANLVRDLKISERVIFQVQGKWSPDILEGLDGIVKVESQGEKTVVYGNADGSQFSASIVTGVVKSLSDAGIQFSELRTEHPDLEDVFLTLTGRQIRDERRV